MSNHLKILIRFQILELNLLKLILKSKRIIKIIKNISGLKNIVFDNQIKCKTQKLKLNILIYVIFSSFVLKVLPFYLMKSLLEVSIKAMRKNQQSQLSFFKHHLLKAQNQICNQDRHNSTCGLKHKKMQIIQAFFLI